MKLGIKQKVLIVLILSLAFTSLLDALLASYFTNRQNQASSFAALGRDLAVWQDDLQSLTVRLRTVALSTAGDPALVSQLTSLNTQEHAHSASQEPVSPVATSNAIALLKTTSLNRLHLILRAGGFSSIAVYADGRLNHYVTSADAGMQVRRAAGAARWIKATSDANGQLPLLSWEEWDEGKPPLVIGRIMPTAQQPRLSFTFPAPDSMGIDIVVPIRGGAGSSRVRGNPMVSTGAEANGDILAVIVFRKLINHEHLAEIARKTGKSPSLFTANGTHSQQFEFDAAQLDRFQTASLAAGGGAVYNTISNSDGSFYAAMLPWKFEDQPPLFLGMSSSRATTLANITETVSSILIAAGVILLLSIGVGVFWVRRFINPILALTSAVKSIALTKPGDDGDEAARRGMLAQLQPVDIAAQDEIGELAAAYNVMLSELRETFDMLEQRVSERTKDLASSLAVLNATLESTADGIYARQHASGPIIFNTQFCDMWGIPRDLLERGDDAEVDSFLGAQVKDTAQFMARAEAILRSPELETFDVIDLRDGRTFERYCRPQHLDGKTVGIVVNYRDVSKRVRAERELGDAQSALLVTARQAGMAEIATNVLHNVGNVLNSVNVSAELVRRMVQTSEVAGLAKALRLMNEREADLGAFMTDDPRGKMLLGYLNLVTAALERERQGVADELGQLSKSVDHIKEIVATQQSYAGAAKLVEITPVHALVEDALRMEEGAMRRHRVTVEKHFSEVPDLPLDKHKVLQILVNLISNAKQAMEGMPGEKHIVILRVYLVDDVNGRRLRIEVEDNGEGIRSEHLISIFSHGFTTRKSGHGFGLHSCALAAREMGGTLVAHSAGPGQGALFVLEIPVPRGPAG